MRLRLATSELGEVVYLRTDLRPVATSLQDRSSVVAPAVDPGMLECRGPLCGRAALLIRRPVFMPCLVVIRGYRRRDLSGVPAARRPVSLSISICLIRRISAALERLGRCSPRERER